MSKNEPAFPIGSGDMRDPIGLTKLEWFAGMALQGLLHGERWSNLDNFSPENLARHSYDLAEAMLAESEKRK